MVEFGDKPQLRKLPLFLLMLAVFFTFSLDVYDVYTTLTTGAPLSTLWLTLFESLADLGCLVAIYILLNKYLVEQWEKTKAIAAISESKSEILSIVSHDLRSPLGVIMGFSQVLEERDHDPENRRLVKRIVANTQHTLNLINDLISQNALDGGGLRVKRAPAAITAILKDVLESQQSAAEQKQIRLVPDPLPEIHGRIDAQKFRQILENVLSNAIKYSPPNSKVAVKLTPTPLGFRLSVKDEGPGLSETECQQVFNKFSPVKKRPTGGEFSTGLGLSITRKLVNLQDGEIWVESRGSGHGSTFHIELPV